MIELRVNGVSIPMPPGISLTRDIETVLLNREKTTADFNYPVTVPLTDEVIVAMNFPNVLANPNLKMEYAADYVEDGQVVDVVTIKILKVSLKTKTADIAIVGSYKTFARIVGDQLLSSLWLNGIRNIGATDSAATYTSTYYTYYGNASSQSHIKSVMKGTLVVDYFFGQAIDHGANIDKIHEDTTGAISGSTYTRFQIKEADGSAGVYKNVINAYNYTDDEPLDPVKAYIYSLYRAPNPASYTVISERFFTVPFFRLAFVLQQCFKESGFTVTGNILTDPAFYRIGLYNTYAINAAGVGDRSGGGSNIANNTNTITPGNHMPEMQVIDFILDIAKNYNLQYEINLVTKTVNIKDFKAGTSEMPVLDISTLAQPNPDIVTEAQDFNKGFAFAFTYDTIDSESGKGIVEDADLSIIYSTVRDITDRDALPANFNNIVYVQSEQTYYRREQDGSWTQVTKEGGKYKTIGSTDGQIEITSACVPMYNQLLSVRHPVAGANVTMSAYPVVSNIGISGTSLLYLDMRTAIPTGQWLQIGTVSTARIKHGTHLINYLGMRPITISHGNVYSNNQPTVSSYNFDGCGLYLTDAISNVWHTTDNRGLYDIFWKKLCDDISAGIQVEYDVLLDPLTASVLDVNKNRFMIDGLLYLCRRASIVKPLPAIAKFTLVRA